MAANGTSGQKLTARANTIQVGEMKFASRMQLNAVYIYLCILTGGVQDMIQYDALCCYAALVSVSFQDWVHSTQAPKSHAVFTVVQCAKS